MKPPLPSASCAALTCAPRSVPSASNRLLITYSFLASVRYLYNFTIRKANLYDFSRIIFSPTGRDSFCWLFQLLLEYFELLRLRMLFVERVERITARYQPVARPRRAI